MRREVTENESGAEGYAGARIRAAHKTGRIISDHVQAIYGQTIRPQRLAARIGTYAIEGSDITRIESDRIEWPLPDGRDARIRLLTGASVEPFVHVRSLVELPVFPGLGALVELFDGAPEFGRVDFAL